MMDEFKWIKLLSLMILMLQVTAATGQHTYDTVRVGHDVTLSCENVIDGQKNCDSTTWLFYGLRDRSLVDLVEHGQIKSKPDRLRVTTNCSLVIKKVTDDDVGLYTCRQFIPGQQEADFQVYLSVITMTEREDNKVVLFCTVLDYDACRYKVEWLYEGKEEISDIEISSPSCSATVTFTSSHLNQRIYELLKCKVTNGYTKKVQLFTFSPQSSGEDATKKKVKSTIKPTATSKKMTTSVKLASSEHTINNNPSDHQGWSWWYMIVPVGLLLLLIFVIIIIRWRKTKGKKTQMKENTELNLNSAETQSGPETSQDTVQPEDGVCYASISYTKKTKSKAKAEERDDDDDDDEGGSVVYSTVKASSSSADPRDFYSTINELNK
ncbi:uncharacterized protein LOC124999278 isoform X2 [Mugil cephalus]|uniref:uncharacterized protein LOC124999278 isoform X2 n=1 Tax=Mugil cephalus TaxID=48193 RepID=UPI001FB6FAF7|nr:uncharacterized protein LOC124999278 isoform X2 [Mugil cephalus]